MCCFIRTCHFCHREVRTVGTYLTCGHNQGSKNCTLLFGSVFFKKILNRSKDSTLYETHQRTENVHLARFVFLTLRLFRIYRVCKGNIRYTRPRKQRRILGINTRHYFRGASLVDHTTSQLVIPSSGAYSRFQSKIVPATTRFCCRDDVRSPTPQGPVAWIRGFRVDVLFTAPQRGVAPQE
jgi:hypothetical protein